MSTPRNSRTFVRLLGFLKPYKWSLAASVALAIGSQAAAVAMAFITGDALEHAIQSEDRERLLWLVTAVVLVGTVTVLAGTFPDAAHAFEARHKPKIARLY